MVVASAFVAGRVGFCFGRSTRRIRVCSSAEIVECFGGLIVFANASSKRSGTAISFFETGGFGDLDACVIKLIALLMSFFMVLSSGRSL